MMSYYAPQSFLLQVFFFEINLLSDLNIFRLFLGEWSCSWNIKQFFDDSAQTLFYKKCRKQMGVYLWNVPPTNLITHDFWNVH